MRMGDIALARDTRILWKAIFQALDWEALQGPDPVKLARPGRHLGQLS